MYALTNCKIYTGLEILNDHAVVIDGNKIKLICHNHKIPKGIDAKNLDSLILAPGFIDIQINGCGGVQFNETLESISIETLEIMQKTNLSSGCTSFLPTLITSSDEFIQKSIQVMREYLNKYSNQALGLHLEGPYINIDKKGIHNINFIRKPSKKMIDFICKNSDIIKVITLAPEKVDTHFVSQLVDSGINVSVGHSNGTYQEIKAGIDAGIKLGTHLFNAMSGITGRDPGAVGAIYDESDVYTSVIADGLHVNWANIRNSHKIKKEKLFLVTDAILPAGTKISEFTFGGTTVYHENGRCFNKNKTLAGSALTMIESVKNCINYMNISLDEALKMASLYPARAIGIDNMLGSIEVGKIANLVVLNANLEIQQTIVNGKMS